MASTKPRQPRLRASCDGCFLAKVKCSKARPICSRCLACGIECRYSPSSRAGKPKSDGSSSIHNSVPTDMSGMSPISDDKGMSYSSHHTVPGLYKLETGWNTPPTSVDGGMSRSHSMSGLAMLGVDTSSGGHGDPSVTGDMYSSGMPWTPPNDMASQFVESPAMSGQMPHGRSQSYDFTMATPMTQWGDQNAHDMYPYGQSQLPTSSGAMSANYFPSPTATPHPRASPRHKSSSTSSFGSSGSCTCFTACLQSLQALHNASSPASPPFDLVLSLNRKAVEGCASMLSCSRCMSRSGTHTAAMLLATVIGKITSFYKNASHTYFENGTFNTAASPNALGVSLGAYTLMGEEGRWLELEILARELRKLEEVYAQFREVCADLSDDPEVSKAMIGYLGHNLGSTLEVIHHRKGGIGYA
ncbi:hypothetical protein B0T17DRAFT_497032 [Bombardia bombarda]|uniref:Zn(2)-C6 fungal-type domain-containing protein n=1 Tax=Bombardia bombarda TaxID=252184 RepID=A0AA39WI96_9PEZI|nr:hypothetical protein B0T17DRAFT_497032 [Bombardia bombarda]